MAKFIHWGIPQFADTWTGRAKCGRMVDPENCAAIFVTCPQCLIEMRKENPGLFVDGAYPSIAPLKNQLNTPTSAD